MADHIVYLRSSGLIWYRRQRNELTEVLYCDDISTAEATLREFIKAEGLHAVTVLLDILEESFALESIPHLNGRDRSALLARKKVQLFPRLRFAYSVVRGREKSGRRDDRVFFSALTDEQVIMPWLTLLFDLQIPLIAIQSLPILSEKVAADLPGGEHKLLISLTEDPLGVSLRQSYFNKNTLALSRFRQLTVGDASEFVSIVKEEVDRSRRFVSRQFHLAQDVRISAHFFYSSPSICDLFKDVDFSGINLEANTYLTSDFALNRGVSLSGAAGLSQWVALQLAKRKSAGHYQDQQSAYYYRHYQLNHRLIYGSALMLLSAFAYTSFSLVENRRLNEAVRQLSQEQQAVVATLERTADAPLLNEFNPFEIRAQLQINERLQQQAIRPELLLTAISRRLQDYPDLQLNALVWGYADDEARQQALASETLAQLTEDGLRLIPITLTASITAFDGNYRQALALIERFARAFAEDPKFHDVKIVKRPIEVDAREELSGTASQPVRDSVFRLDMRWEHS